MRAAAGGDPFRVALLDVGLEGVGADVVARSVRAEPALRDTDLLLLAPLRRGTGEEARAAEEAGFTRLLTKPVRPSQLMDALAQALNAGPGGPWHAPEAATTAAGLLAPAREGDGPRVLVAEDNAVNQRLARRLLENRGCRVDVAGDGAEALRMLGRAAYDLVLLDCHMPVMDGFETAREIRRREQRQADGGGRTPVVAMTADLMPGTRERCLAAGMDEHVGKPISPEALERLLVRFAAPPTTADPSPTCAGTPTPCCSRPTCSSPSTGGRWSRSAAPPPRRPDPRRPRPQGRPDVPGGARRRPRRRPPGGRRAGGGDVGGLVADLEREVEDLAGSLSALRDSMAPREPAPAR
jgi:CheY-like chemotaxis protein